MNDNYNELKMMMRAYPVRTIVPEVITALMEEVSTIVTARPSNMRRVLRHQSDILQPLFTQKITPQRQRT